MEILAIECLAVYALLLRTVSGSTDCTEGCFVTDTGEQGPIALDVGGTYCFTASGVMSATAPALDARCTTLAGAEGLATCPLRPFGHPFLSLFIEQGGPCPAIARCGTFVGSGTCVMITSKEAYLRVASYANLTTTGKLHVVLSRREICTPDWFDATVIRDKRCGVTGRDWSENPTTALLRWLAVTVTPPARA